MRLVQRAYHVVCLVLILVLPHIILAGCTIATPQTPRLRIINRGTEAVDNLTVIFPEDEVMFGNVSASTTTEYLDVPNGVFGYAAYRFEIGGQVILQPVVDWVGEAPLKGNSFTYAIDFDSNRPKWGMVRLIEVSIDE
jgi:hypothetical protein